jgi:hypothetical protein
MWYLFSLYFILFLMGSADAIVAAFVPILQIALGHSFALVGYN